MFKFKKKHNYKIDRYYQRLLIGVGILLVILIVLIVTRNNDDTYSIIDLNGGINLFNDKYNKEPQRDYDVIDDHVSIKVLDEGYNIYAPASGSSGYQYGPSILINDDGSLDAFFSTPGNNSSEWDWIVYRHSDDGLNWSKDKVVLQPTGNSYDHYSICDPGVIYFDGYYYLGYTSTIVATDNGINNNVFVARSKNPDGPYEKWNGNGWGGKPKPIIYYNEDAKQWGAGEVSFVVKDDTLYCYYSWHCEHGTYTKVSTAPIGENWPSELEYQGIANIYKDGQDSCDVVYLEDVDKFVMFAVSERFSNNSGIIIYESNDGIEFSKSDIVHTNVAKFAHNMGITKHLDGHIKEDDDLSIVYAYSNRKNSTGIWATRLQNIELIVYQSKKPKKCDKDGEPTLYNDVSSRKANNYVIGISAEPRSINIEEGSSKYLNVFAYQRNRSKYEISDLSFEYDDEYIEMNGNLITGLKEGESEIKIYSGEFYTTATVIVHKDGYLEDEKRNYIDIFDPVEETIVLHLNDDNYHSVQIRTYVEFRNGKWGEAYNDFTSSHPKYPSMIPAEEYYIDYHSDNKNIVDVSDDGILEPRSAGTANVEVVLYDDVKYDLTVTVVD